MSSRLSARLFHCTHALNQAKKVKMNQVVPVSTTEARGPSMVKLNETVVSSSVVEEMLALLIKALPVNV
jgi:creatinine amidohydrolase/Fe(II)-dependent formamide hydrolase-like protein